jgi:hypothetical protein
MEIDRDQATGLPAGLVERRAGRCESVRAATTTWRCCCCRRRLSTRDATSTDAGGVKNAAVTSRLFLFPRALFPPDADPSSPASVCTWIRAYRRAPLIFLPKKKGGERRKEKRKREEKSVLTALLLRDSDSLTAAARGLRVLTTHAHAPVVTETAVAPDLPQPVKVLTDLEVQTVREHLGKTTCRQVSHHPDTKGMRRSSPPQCSWSLKTPGASRLSPPPPAPTGGQPLPHATADAAAAHAGAERLLRCPSTGQREAPAEAAAASRPFPPSCRSPPRRGLRSQPR